MRLKREIFCPPRSRRDKPSPPCIIFDFWFSSLYIVILFAIGLVAVAEGFRGISKDDYDNMKKQF